MRVITVANGKGGVGKTTTSIYLALAACLAHPDARVLLLDLDPQRSATDWANIASDEGDSLPFEVRRGSLQKLQALQGFDYVLVDTAPAISDTALRSLCSMSEIVVIPTEAEGLGLSKTYDTDDVCGDKGIVLVTRARPRTRVYSEAMNALEDAGVARFDTVIHDSVRYKTYGIVPPSPEGYADVWNEIEEELQ